MIEFVAKLDEQFLWHLDGGIRHRNRVPEHKTFQIREHGAHFVLVQGPEFLILHTLLPADRRPDIDSERAADHHGNFNVSQRFELGWHCFGGLLPQFHMGQRP